MKLINDLNMHCFPPLYQGFLICVPTVSINCLSSYIETVETSMTVETTETGLDNYVADTSYVAQLKRHVRLQIEGKNS